MNKHSQLVRFLEQELAIPEEAIALGLRQVEGVPSLLPISLWKYGFVTADQLNQIFDWLEMF
jgi:hypothetical protein